MERENIFTDEEVVARILGLPLERIEFLKEEHKMPVAEPAFSSWFVEHPHIILDELKRQDDIRMNEVINRHEDASAKSEKIEETPTGVSAPASYDS